MRNFKSISSRFAVYGDFVIGVPFGNGHINDTYALTFDQGGNYVRYILQRINRNVFKQPSALMENYRRVTEHLRNKISAEKTVNPACRKRTLQLISARDGGVCATDEDGEVWRMYSFIENARTYEVAQSPEQVFQSARAFGEFQLDLTDLGGERLHETIADFHNTPKRLDQLEAAAKTDSHGRLKEVRREFDFFMARRKESALLMELQRSGEIPERITHNDTKLNNVLFDDLTGCGVCVIDLDTVMPGLVHYDFGDMVRTGGSSGAEDETDLDKIEMRFDLFEALLRGYCSEAGKFLNETEFSLLPFSARLITMEIGSRFLTDYLSGDGYFKIKRPTHNLDRCRTQIKLVQSMEKQEKAMQNLLKTLKK